MTDVKKEYDWDPRSEEVLHHPLAAFDQMRTECPVAHSEYMGWSVFRHKDVLRVVEDHETFSNQVSQHRSVPNGLDKPEHTPYRALIEPYFSQARMAGFEPLCRELSENLIRTVLGRQAVDIIPELAENFALEIQCAFLGWPNHLQEPLRQWAHENQEATLAGNREAMNEIAQRFSRYIHDLLESRREQGEWAPDDVTTEIMNSRINGNPISENDIVSILRNWTVGEIGTIAASIGLLLQYLSEHLDLQDTLRREPERIPEAVEEILRIHGPLVTNRRRTTRPVTLGSRSVGSDERVTVNWVSANRDERVFPEPDRFRWGRDQSQNLLYGAGLHVCPGAPLARLELRVFLEELLAATNRVTPSIGKTPVNAHYPASGYQHLWLDFS
ncbi:cytochrome P450 [Marinimicrobium agarilyticum]|uniref:cytochrome P450 n=1 Tax=Marinimicrobium agarilyticum TaxID=306546 RepID=UPI000422AB27|nr:cytochrome P450 [Marinimicrobium agarilyticum]